MYAKIIDPNRIRTARPATPEERERILAEGFPPLLVSTECAPGAPLPGSVRYEALGDYIARLPAEAPAEP